MQFIKEHSETLINVGSLSLSLYSIFTRNQDPDLQIDKLSRIYGAITIILLGISVKYKSDAKIQLYILVLNTIISLYTIAFYYKRQRKLECIVETLNMIGTIVIYKYVSLASQSPK